MATNRAMPPPSGTSRACSRRPPGWSTMPTAVARRALRGVRRRASTAAAANAARASSVLDTRPSYPGGGRTPARAPLLGGEQPVTRVAEPGQDVAVLVEAAVHRRGV